MTERVLTTRELNRALLARQLLLERGAMPVAAAVEHLVGLQAQTPLSPYVALWSRLRDFDPLVLSDLLESRQVLRIGLLRTTIHLVTARDALRLRPVVQSALDRAWRSSGSARNLTGIDMAAVLADSRRLLEERPLTASEIGRALAGRWPDHDPTSLGYASRFLLPLVQVPPRGLWRRTGTARHTTLEAWTGRSMAGSTGAEDAVLRYLAAFGPASVADMRIWSWLAGLREVVERLRPRLRVLRDGRGRELFDLPDAPLPDPDTPAPPRFLPDFDNLVLSHDDRSRVVPPAVTQQATWDWGALLVDGFVTGTWKVIRAKEGATVQVKTFRQLRPVDEMAVHEEGIGLLTFLAPDAAAREVRVMADPGHPHGRTR